MNAHEMSKKKRKRRVFTDDYKAEVVRLCRQPGKTAHGVAKELGLTPSAVMGWVKQASVDAGGGRGVFVGILASSRPGMPTS